MGLERGIKRATASVIAPADTTTPNLRGLPRPTLPPLPPLDDYPCGDWSDEGAEADEIQIECLKQSSSGALRLLAQRMSALRPKAKLDVLEETPGSVSHPEPASKLKPLSKPDTLGEGSMSKFIESPTKSAPSGTQNVKESGPGRTDFADSKMGIPQRKTKAHLGPCHQCGQMGHIAKDCMKPRGGNSGAGSGGGSAVSGRGQGRSSSGGIAGNQSSKKATKPAPSSSRQSAPGTMSHPEDGTSLQFAFERMEIRRRYHPHLTTLENLLTQSACKKS
jgi:hypothetical protein